MAAAERLAATSLTLGEGPIRTATGFACVDIVGGLIIDGGLDGAIEQTTRVDGTVGAVAATSCDRRVAAIGTSIQVLGDDRRIALHDPPSDLRFNDGKADPAGRFVCGTMADPPRAGVGALWSFEQREARLLLDEVTISNGLAWSDSGETMFYIDTPTQRIDAFDFDASTGTISERRTIVEIDAESGAPDGMTIDSEGALWVALWGGGCVHRYLDGRLDELIRVPTPYVTCPAFVGDDLDTLIITTASLLNPGEPGAGDLYIAQPNVTGVPPAAVELDVVFG